MRGSFPRQVGGRGADRGAARRRRGGGPKRAAPRTLRPRRRDLRGPQVRALNPSPSPSPSPKPSPGLSPGRSPCPQTLTRAFRLTRRPSPPSRRWRCGSPSCDLSSTPTPSAPPSARRAPRSWACTGCTRRDPRICATARAALRPLSSRPCMTLELHCQVSCAVSPVSC